MLDLYKSYEELCEDCIKLYGAVSGNFFIEAGKQNLDIKRSNEGLQIHHIKECDDIFIFVSDLSKWENAKNYPEEFQNKENLCYCNLIDHFLLHVKIDLWRSKKFKGKNYHEGSDLLFYKLKNIFYLLDESDPYFLAIKDNFDYFKAVYRYWKEEKEKLFGKK